MTTAATAAKVLESVDVRAALIIQSLGGKESIRQQPRTVIFPDGSEMAFRFPRWIEVRA